MYLTMLLKVWLCFWLCSFCFNFGIAESSKKYIQNTNLGTVTKRLDSVFKQDKESLARILFYLVREQTEYKDIDQDGPMIKMLLFVMDDDKLFKEYGKQLAEDTKKAQMNEEFKKFLDEFYDKMLDATKETADIENIDINFLDTESLVVKASPGIALAMGSIPLESRLQILKVVEQFLHPKLSKSVTGIVNAVNEAGGDMMMVNLATVQLGYDVVINIKRWYNGEISGKRVTKNIIDSISKTCGYTGGGMAGVSMGSFFGPFGMVVGGAVGGIIGGTVAEEFSDWLTLKIFNIPKAVALENAYNFFNLNRDASNHDINQAYRAKSLKYHPDKGGSNEQFHTVQIHMAIIKAAKGQTFYGNMAPKLYGHVMSPCVRAVLLTAKALNIELEYVNIDVLKREHLSEQFLKINPQHTIPTLVLDDDFVLSDSHTINIYLAEKYGNGSSLYPKDLQKRAVINRLLFFECGEIFAMHELICTAVISQRSKEVPKAAADEEIKALQFLETFLKESKYVAGDEMTIADFTLWTTISNTSTLVPVDEKKFPRITDWMKLMNSLPYQDINESGAKMMKTFVDSLLNG